MGELAQRMLHEALNSFVSHDAEAAQAVLDQDDVIDALKNQIFRELLTYMLGDPRTIESSVQLILISRHLERVGDHATNIAEDVIFMVEARDIRHRSVDPMARSDQGTSRRAADERRKESGTAPV